MTKVLLPVLLLLVPVFAISEIRDNSPEIRAQVRQARREASYEARMARREVRRAWQEAQRQWRQAERKWHRNIRKTSAVYGWERLFQLVTRQGDTLVQDFKAAIAQAGVLSA
jgi:hypothetical protein